MTSDCSSSTLLSIDLSSWYEVPWVAAGSSRLTRATRGCRGAQPSPCGAQARGRRPAWKPVAIATRQPNLSNQADAIALLMRRKNASFADFRGGEKTRVLKKKQSGSPLARRFARRVACKTSCIKYSSCRRPVTDLQGRRGPRGQTARHGSRGCQDERRGTAAEGAA